MRWIANLFRMDDEGWRRHANPWSVYTGLAAIPMMILAVWSRAWIGWWSLLPIVGVMLWLFLNPHVFPPVPASHGWAARGIHGERLWLESRGEDLPSSYRRVLRWPAIPGGAGGILLLWGLVELSPWPTSYGATLLILAQLWRIDRLGLLYETIRHSEAATAGSRQVPDE
ncbi:hypothetical protein J4G37_21770 [Microvirga sp. 3-52]|nr:hypothetical protein [Microvirga sp. 3-52]